MNKLLNICLAICLVPPAVAMNRAHFLELNQKAAELRKQKDWARLLKVMIEIGHELPGDTPRYVLRMASVEVHLGHTSQAVQWMAKYASMGLTYDVASDEDLAPLARDDSFKVVAAKLKENAKPIRKAELACTLPLPDLMPEDLTFDATSSRTFVVSSIQHHTLYRVKLPSDGSTECSISELPLPPDAKRWPTLAVSADSRRNAFWMTASAMPGFGGFPKEDDGKAELLAIDGTTGKVLRRLYPATGSKAVLGDMSVGYDGSVYVSDSVGGGVYRVRGELNNSTLDKIAEGLFSPQTPVLARDGRRVFVADYPMGIAIIDLKRQDGDSNSNKNSLSKAVTLNYLKHPSNVAVTGLDGLYLYQDSLIGIQNGTEPARIIRFRLNHAQTEILSAEIIEQSTERLGEPTHVIELDGWFYVTANVGWGKIDDSGALKAGQQFTSPTLLRFH
ncbi:MAG TPA: hypothetical protein VHA33_07950 [Candidatus Angelobacter sp.]|jgi:hypothetical protein|nr:hypothetical protein [Candidatus Angelobacter sp.]